ncbi:MAG: HAD family hydrolase [Thermoanaerobaculia bacterium]
MTTRTATPRMVRHLLFPALLLALAGSPPPAHGGAFCAVFFDLGNTLVDTSGPAPYPLFADAQATIDTLQARGIPLGIITNVPAGWDHSDLEAILQQPAFLDEFEALALSSEAGASKPAPAIYLYAFGLLAPPQHGIGATAFVGETLSEIADAEVAPTTGARAVGMTGIHLSSASPSPLADFTIANLTALLAIATESCFVFDSGFESGDFTGWQNCAGCI